ncbi:MAG: PAS domain S-box protein [Armatimonadetes bacterium]|nr:PAS domain S-box protein [Armatimonadota bacterium]
MPSEGHLAKRILPCTVDTPAGPREARLFIVEIGPREFRATSYVSLPADREMDIRFQLQGERCVEARIVVVGEKEIANGRMRQLDVRFVEIEAAALHTLLTELEGTPPGRAPELEAGIGKASLKNLGAEELDRMACLGRISRILNESYRLEEVLARVMDLLVTTLDSERGLLILEREGELEVAASRGGGDRYSLSIVQEVLTSGKPMVCLDASLDHELSASRSLRLLGTRSILCVPLKNPIRTFGLLYLDSSLSAVVFGEAELAMTTIIADMAVAAIERADFFACMIENEQEVHRAQQRLRHLLSASPAIIYSLDPAGDRLGFVSGNLQHIGYGPTEAYEEGFWTSRVHSEDRARYGARSLILQKKGVHEMEYRFLHRDGGYRWIRDEAVLIRDGNGRPKEIVGSVCDVTVRKLAEQELFWSRQNFSNLVDRLPHGILILDPEGTVLFCNPAAERLLGKKMGELLAQPLDHENFAPGLAIRREPTEWDGRAAVLVSIAAG